MKIDVRNGKVDQALRKFKRKIMDDNRLFDYREREYYEKPAQKKKSKKKAAILPQIKVFFCPDVMELVPNPYP
mgnify:CR=1 FL=1